MEKIKSPRVTLKSIAQYSGFGTTTISDILLREKSNYAPETVRLVREAANKLGYRPNCAARNLRQGRTGTIGMLISFDISNPFFKTLMQEVEKLLDSAGYLLQIALSAQDSARNAKAMRIFESGHVDGVLAGPVYLRETLYPRHEQYRSELPTVFFLSPDSAGKYTVDTGNSSVYSPECLPVRHLLEAGHRRIGYLMCPEHCHTDCGASMLRQFHDTLAPLGLYNPDWVWIHPDATLRNGYQMMSRILEQHSRAELPTAFLVHNDYSALGAMSAIRDKGFSIPEDFSLIGCDDIEFSAFASPPLTTMCKYPERIATQSVELLLRVLENPDLEETHLRIPETLQARRSVRILS